MTPFFRQYRQAFTLIELSIVLVIIGLIAGGVLAGRELIRAAQLRGDISAVEKFDRAVNAFRLKYNCLPGDCMNAGNFFSFPSPENGDGDGIIRDPDGFFSENFFQATEYSYAIDHLARAGLIEMSPYDANDTALNANDLLPKLPSGGYFMVRNEYINPDSGIWANTGRHVYRLGVSDDRAHNVAALATRPAPYTPAEAYSIDSKIDDGNALTGKVTAGMNFYSTGTPFYPVSVYYTGGSCAYAVNDVGIDLINCQYDFSKTQKINGLFIQSSGF